MWNIPHTPFFADLVHWQLQSEQFTTKQDDMENISVDKAVSTPYARKAMKFSLLAAILFILSAVFTAYGIVCPTSASICLPDTVNAILSGTAVLCLTVGTLATVAGILYAVESIAVMEETKKSYLSLAILLFSVVGIVGTVYQFFTLKAVGIIFHRGY